MEVNGANRNILKTSLSHLHEYHYNTDYEILYFRNTGNADVVFLFHIYENSLSVCFTNTFMCHTLCDCVGNHDVYETHAEKKDKNSIA